MMLVKAGANIAIILDSTEDEVQEITQTAKYFALDELTDCARIFAQNDLMQKNQGTPQLGLELALLTAIERHRQGSHSQTAQSPHSESTSHSRTTTAPVAPAAPAATITRPAQTPPPVQPQTPPVQAQPTSSPMKQEEQMNRPVVQEVKAEPAVQDETAGTSDELPEWDTLSYDDDEEYEDSPVKPVVSESTTHVEPMPIAPVHPTPPAVSTQESGSSEEYAQEETPPFTLADVKEKWEQIKRRVRSRKEGMIAASVLNDFAVVAVQGTANDVVVIAQAAHIWHYSRMQEDSSIKVVEWALKIELGQECRVKFLSPEQLVTLPPPSAFALPRSGESLPTNGATSSGHASTASRARSHSTKQVTETPTKQQAQHEQSSAQNHDTNYVNETPPSMPVARMHTVRENSTGSTDVRNGNRDTTSVDTVHVDEPPSVREAMEALATTKEARPVASVEVAEAPASFVVDETRRALLERKAKSDPVVQKVTEMFKANMKEVRPK